MAMTIWVCATCATEQSDTAEPPGTCPICSDERQWVPPEGQQWTTHQQLRADGVRVRVRPLEPGLHGLEAHPGVGINQRGLLVRTSGGNLLWEPPGVFDDETVAAVRDLGGVHAIASSHPHLVGASVSWSHAFDGAPVWWGRADRRWVQRHDPAIRLWSGEQTVLPGVTLVQCGGHFPGSCVAHWADGADGRGALLTGDTIAIGGDLASVSFMRSYVNLLPLPERLVRGIVAAAGRRPYDRLYGAFRCIDSGGPDVVARSADRFVGWMHDEIRDPDEQATPSPREAAADRA